MREGFRGCRIGLGGIMVMTPPPANYITKISKYQNCIAFENTIKIPYTAV